MIDRLTALARGREVATAVVAAALLGALLTLVPLLDRALLLVASVALMLALGALGVWLVRAHRNLEWTTSAGAPERIRGSDRRVTALARSIDAALAGDGPACGDVQATVRSVAEARLAQLGLPTTVTGDAARAALGPELTAYLSVPGGRPVSEGELAAFITTLEEN